MNDAAGDDDAVDALDSLAVVRAFDVVGEMDEVVDRVQQPILPPQAACVGTVGGVGPCQQAVGIVTNRLGLEMGPAVSVVVISLLLCVPVVCGAQRGLLWVWLRAEGRLVGGCRWLLEGH